MLLNYRLFRHIKIFVRHLTTSTNKIILQNAIKTNTKISRNHLTPEIALHLITPECKLFHECYTENVSKIFPNDPFWAFYWPGGQALSRYILDYPEIVKSKRILDIGCGSGACSIAAILSGACYVIANDIDEVSTLATLINANLNGIQHKHLFICNKNLIGSSNIREDTILLGDLFYDEDISEILLPWLIKLRNSGKNILIGDPGRNGLKCNGKFRSCLIKLKSYELPKNACIENNGFTCVNVWKMK